MSEKILERIAISNFNYRRWSFGYFLESVKKLGLKNIELCGCHPHFTNFEAEEFPVQRLADEIKAAGISVPVIMPEQNFLPVNIAAVNPFFREQSIKQIQFYIQSAKVFDCSKVVVYPGKAFMDHPHSEGWMYARESIKKLCEIAKEHGVVLLMSPVSGFVSNLMTDCKTTERMLDEIGADNLEVCVNSSIVGYVGDTLETYFKTFGNKIGHVQLADAVEDCDQLAWGEGDLNLAEQIAVLKKYGYEGPVSMELLMEEYAEDPHGAHADSLEYMKSHMEEEEHE